jgi:hypothetical protein
MGNVQQAVLEFDQEIQAPWRPRLVVVGAESGGVAAARPPLAHPSRRSPSRVGVCRPPESPRPVRQDMSRPDGRPSVPGSGRSSRPPAHRRPVAGRPVSWRTSAPLRLTRRARRLAVLLGIACGVVLGSWLAPLVSGQDGELRLAGETTVVVQPGDTLWSIASSLDAEADVRAVIDEIQALNGLSGGDIAPGQTLVLP